MAIEDLGIELLLSLIIALFWVAKGTTFDHLPEASPAFSNASLCIY